MGAVDELIPNSVTLLTSEEYPMSAAALLVQAARLARGDMASSQDLGNMDTDQENHNTSHRRSLKSCKSSLNSSSQDRATSRSYRVVTVYSSPCDSGRKRKLSSDLPRYVKRIMQDDPALKKLVDCGSITISRVLHETENDSNLTEELHRIKSSTPTSSFRKHDMRNKSKKHAKPDFGQSVLETRKKLNFVNVNPTVNVSEISGLAYGSGKQYYSSVLSDRLQEFRRIAMPDVIPKGQELSLYLKLMGQSF